MPTNDSLKLYRLSLPLASLAITLMAQTGTGTLPTYTPALIIATASPLTLGLTTMIFSAIFLICQQTLKTTHGTIGLTDIWEIFLFGLLIDLWSFLFSDLANASFGTHVLCLIIASFLLAAVRILQEEAQHYLLAADALTATINHRFPLLQTWRFQVLDIIGLVLGLLLSFIFFKQLMHIGIGTLIPVFMIPFCTYVLRRGLVLIEDSGFL